MNAPFNRNKILMFSVIHTSLTRFSYAYGLTQTTTKRTKQNTNIPLILELKAPSTTHH